MNKFVLSTLVAAAAMTSTAWAEGTITLISGEASTTFSSFSDALSNAKDGDKIIVTGEYNPDNLYVGKIDSDIDVTVVFENAKVKMWGENFRVDSGSTANVVGGSTITYPTAPVRGTLNIGNEEGQKGVVTGVGFNIYGEEGAETASINVYADSQLIATPEVPKNASYVGHESNANRKGELNIYGGAVLTNVFNVNATGTVNISGGSFEANSLTNRGTFNVSGNSTLNIVTLSGNAVQVVGDTTLTDSTIGGGVSFGYNQYLEGGKTLTFEGSNKIGTLYIGNKINVAGASPNYTNGEKHEVLVKGALTVGTLNNRATSVTTVEDGATLTVGDTVNRGQLIIKGSMVIDVATAGAGTGHFEINEDDTDSASASLTLDGGSFVDKSSGGYIAVGANGSGASTDSAAYMELKNNASFTTAGMLYLANGANNYISVNNSTLTAGTIANNGSIVVSGNSAIDAKISGEGLLQISDGTLTFEKGVETKTFIVGKSGYLTTEVDAGTGATVTVTGENKITGTADTATWVGLADNTDWSAGNKGKFVLNITGKNTNWDGGSTHIANAGQLNITDGAYAELTYTKVRGGLTVDASTVDIKSQMNVYGEENYADGDKSDESDVLLSNADFKVLNGSSVAVSGSLTVGKDSNVNRVGTVTVDGSELSVGGTITIYAGSAIKVGEGSTLSASVIAGKGDVVLAGTINVVTSLSAGNLTIHAGATLNIGSSEGVALMAEVSAIEFDTLTIIATDVKVGEDLDLSSIITGTGSEGVWAALGDGTEFTVVDSETKISYTGVYNSANGGSVSIVPEPSAFGLLAGLGAIALAVSRRRRNCR
ncbi:MAG: PEP-CTERM sorting domain-containing protein [Opitutales bacterium]|nr:PEP-CTERM sorting domain-containing protein [Opitutales bacterium]